MSKKENYNKKTIEALVEELKKLRATLRDLQAEKLKTGNANKYRTARKNIARIQTELNARRESGQTSKNQ